MRKIVGVDIGNSTTEVCIGQIDNGALTYLASASRTTTGTKGTVANVHAIKSAMQEALESCGLRMEDLDEIRLNEAAPVIGDTAMETITETIITESSMIGHNPSTPAGFGQAAGMLLSIKNLSSAQPGIPYILTASRAYPFEDVAKRINALPESVRVCGLILQADEAVLVENRLNKKIPILDEVARIEDVPEGKLAAIEVALPGQSIRMLSNPYGIATLLKLDPEETRQVTPIAKSLIGKKSAVVIKTPHGNVRENVLPAGTVTFHGDTDHTVEIDAGAAAIMQGLEDSGQVRDISGETGTNIGTMLGRIRRNMSNVSEVGIDDVKITDLLAVDTLAPVEIAGALAGETCMEKAVGIAAMVRTQKLPMQQIADRLKEDLHIPEVKVAGVEAVMATFGALTTPGTTLPVAILDMGGGSTDAALITRDGKISLTHRAGAGELVTMLIRTELGLKERNTAEQIKKYPLAKVESLYHLRLENGEMQFFDQSLDPRLFGHVVLLTGTDMIRIDEDIPMEKIVQVRQEAKRKVFVVNALRALRTVAPQGDLKNLSYVVLVGGSAEDFEIPAMLMEELASYRIVCGRGNIRGTEGPRNAVATGLVLSAMGDGL
ncbi:MAG: diol dehydratase reactivase subunit alpha [Clostridia bacterium]|nr:diol dehydratase reactivase subunit alpha [Clostridia bacterium]